MKLNDMAAECHALAVKKGWYNPPKASIIEHICLMHTELSEAVEEYRHGHAESEMYYSCGRPDGKPEQCALPCENCMCGIPEGIPVEFADLLIRMLDTCGFFGIDLDAAYQKKMEYNRMRPIRHGGKKT